MKTTIKPRCAKTSLSGYVITFGSGLMVTIKDKGKALSFYKKIHSPKVLSICDAGYIIPLLGE